MHRRNAPLTVVGRQRAVAQVVDAGRPIAHVAAEFRIARTTLSKWVGRFREHGELGLQDHSSAPANRPTRLPIWVPSMRSSAPCAWASIRSMTASSRVSFVGKWCSMPGWESPTWSAMFRRLAPWYPCSANICAAPSRIASLRALRPLSGVGRSTTGVGAGAEAAGASTPSASCSFSAPTPPGTAIAAPWEAWCSESADLEIAIAHVSCDSLYDLGKRQNLERAENSSGHRGPQTDESRQLR